jgi:hypothetical protein
MSGRLVLRPGAVDRLDPVAAALRWWISRLAAALPRRRPAALALKDLEEGGRRLSGAVAVALPAEEIFVSRVALPPGRSDAHRRALALRLPDLAPLPPSALEIAARSERRGEDGAVVYAVAMARADRLTALEAAARRRGAKRVAFVGEADRGVTLETARARRARARGALLDAALVLAVALTAVWASSAATRRLEAEARALLAADEAARRAAVAEARVAQEAALVDVLLAQGALERRAGAAIEDLAALNAATPDGAWWTRVRWTPGEVAIAGASPEAAAAIERLSAAAGATRWRVALAGAVQSSGSGGTQSFELRARRAESEPREGEHD